MAAKIALLRSSQQGWIEAIREAYRISGACDYLLKVEAADRREWREIANHLLRNAVGVDKITIHIRYE